MTPLIPATDVAILLHHDAYEVERTQQAAAEEAARLERITNLNTIDLSRVFHLLVKNGETWKRHSTGLRISDCITEARKQSPNECRVLEFITDDVFGKKHHNDYRFDEQFTPQLYTERQTS